MGHCCCDGTDQSQAGFLLVLTTLNQMEARLVATFNQNMADIAAALTELTKDVQRALDVITSGELNAEQQAAVDAIKTSVANMDAAVEAVTPEPVTPPEPTA